MADPPPFPFSDLHFDRALTSLVLEVGIEKDVWPSDVDDVSQTSVHKGLQLVGVDLVVLHVSELYSKTDLMLVLKILILLWRERPEEFQIGQRVLNICLALLIRFLMSSVPFIFVDEAAQVNKLLHLIQVFVVECDGVLFLVVSLHHLRLLDVNIEALLLSFFG